MTTREKEFDAFLDSDAIDDDFFVEIVEKKLNIKREKFKLRVVAVRSAAGDGDNYNSLLYRVKIKVKLLESNENVSVDVIIKALLKTVKEFSDDFGYFDRERLIYEEILKSFEHIWLERANEVVEFAPHSYNFKTEPYEIIVLEDLKASGYEMLDRKVGCTLPQAKTLLSKLAKFHAAGAVCYRKVNFVIIQCCVSLSGGSDNKNSSNFLRVACFIAVLTVQIQHLKHQKKVLLQNLLSTFTSHL